VFLISVYIDNYKQHQNNHKLFSKLILISRHDSFIFLKLLAKSMKDMMEEGKARIKKPP